MDLGIAGRRAMVCGSSDGLGFASAAALAEAGCEVLLNGRDPDRLEAARARLAAAGHRVLAVAADVTRAEGQDRLFTAMPTPDILVTNAGGPPPGTIEDWGEDDWHAALQANMVTPIMLMKRALPAMRAAGWGRIVNVTSAAVKAPIATLGLSNGARTGLTGFVGGLAREVARDGVTINNLLPGRFATRRHVTLTEAEARRRGIDPETVREEIAAGNPTRRIGRPDEFGAACAFLCSAQAGFINAQNWLLDGGAFPGTL